MNERKPFALGIVLILVILTIHLVILNDYGLTWDFHHHFFAGLHLLRQPITEEMTRQIPFTIPDPRLSAELPFGPLMSIAPTASYLILFEGLKLLTFDSAYNFMIVVIGISGILILFLFLKEALDSKIAMVGALFLALLPRYFGDLHNNMKDVPQAVAFAFALFMVWRLVYYRRPMDLWFAVIAFAIAFNTKVNTVAVPIIAFLWVCILLIMGGLKHIKKPLIRSVGAYFVLAPLAAYALWSLFFSEPLNTLLYIPRFFRLNTLNIEVLYFGKWYCSAINVPWHYPYGYLAITTPLPILFFFIIGLLSIFGQIIKVIFKLRTFNNELITKLLFLLWFFVPLARYLIPTMGVLDGIRHFEEVVFPLTAIAAIGAVTIGRWWIHRSIFSRQFRKSVTVLTGMGIAVALVIPIIFYHPYQITYFNELVGGLKGAFGRFDLDYWGTSQKAAMEWLNENAKQDSIVHVVMAADVAAKYLRPDLREHMNTTWYDDADYVVVLNRQSFFYRYFYIVEYMLMRKPAYVVESRGVPLTWIFDNSLGQFPRGREWWHGDSPCIEKYWAITPE